MKRLFDFVMATMLVMLFAVPMILIAIAVRLTSKGPALYWSDRIGRANVVFKMPKFRSMRVDTPSVATHLMTDPNAFLSPIGAFLRRFSLDELPQLFSVLKGEMSFVGPRPALYNQDDLIALRTDKEVDKLLPGITGWAQINGWRGDTDLKARIEHDLYYIDNWSVGFDLKIIFLTIFKGFISKNAY